MASSAISQLLFPLLLLPLSHAATFTVVNNCSFTIWTAAVPAGGGRQLNRGQTCAIDVNPGAIGSIWARTNCTFDGSGRGSCETGDCGGLLECQDHGTPPNTLVEFALNQFSNRDFFDISLADGFNVPVNFIPDSTSCRGTRCAADINGQCPEKLRAPGGCNHPCTVFKTDEYCCTSSCAPNEYFRFFKKNCPDAYIIYPQDGPASTMFCPGGTNYTVVFCP
ncbi:hypothetical protein Cni_G24137 [Canna indica]|uniref:Thaumatin-like protein n=1 Tax=Canna indica TaxID=4628 RepID=A0AAQ3KZP3_9LILI|nr:hypothetical protein Cni_G24137 [Canna indica]